MPPSRSCAGTRNFAPTVHGLYINGTHQASDTPTMVGYHRLIGTLPVAIHSEPRRALVIGAGGGATAGAVAAFSDQHPRRPRRALAGSRRRGPAVQRHQSEPAEPPQRSG